MGKLTLKDKDTLEEVFAQFLEWYENDENVKNNIDGVLDNELGNDEKAFQVKDFNLGLKKNIRQRIEEHDPRLFVQPIFNEEKKSNDYKVLKLTEHARKLAEGKRNQLRELQWMDAVGVSYLWVKLKEKIQKDLISVVGYSCLYDLTYWYSHFEGQLTKDYQKFKADLHAIFRGGIFDSRIIALSNGVEEDEGLEDIHNNLKEGEKYVSFPEERFDPMAQEGHTTGKDSYMTGIAFLDIARKLDPKAVTDLVNIVEINPNVLYAYNFGVPDKDVAWNKSTWVAVCKEKTAKKLRLVDNKGPLLQKGTAFPLLNKENSYEEQLELTLNQYRNLSESLNRKRFNPQAYPSIIKEPLENPGEKSVRDGFLKMLQDTIQAEVTNCPHTVYQHSRHRIFQGHYFFYVEFESPGDVSRLIKAVPEFAEIITLEEHHEKMLDVYSERITKQF